MVSGVHKALEVSCGIPKLVTGVALEGKADPLNRDSEFDAAPATAPPPGIQRRGRQGGRANPRVGPVSRLAGQLTDLHDSLGESLWVVH